MKRNAWILGVLLGGCWSTSQKVGPLLVDVQVQDGQLVGKTCYLKRTVTQMLDKSSTGWSVADCRASAITADLPKGGAR